MDAVLYVVREILFNVDWAPNNRVVNSFNIFPEGGVLILALDLDGLADAADIDSGLGTVDGFMVRMVQDPVFENLQGR